ncbi:MAG TPA: hypothetical protein VGT60_06745 [Candidatus Limnocylindria bacterium]|nr:hypothetical protein [Candidatus Limnocylindria bacterium]
MDRLTTRAEQLVLLSDDLASLGALEAAGRRLDTRSTNVVNMIHELRAGAADRKRASCSPCRWPRSA